MTKMLEGFRKATLDDFPALLRFYERVCSAQERDEYSPQWHYGVYPAPEDLISHINAGEVLLAESGTEIAAACVLVFGDDPIYRLVSWPTDSAPEEICTLHLFAVHPACRRQGVSAALLEHAIICAKNDGRRVLRLDVVKGNLPAEKLYQSKGFDFVQERKVFYEDTGELLVRLYELGLTTKE